MNSSAAPRLPPTSREAAPVPQGAIWIAARGLFWVDANGVIGTQPHPSPAVQFKNQAVLVCHAPAQWARQRGSDSSVLWLDLLELFVFLRPGVFLTPTPMGLAKACGLSPPTGEEDYPVTLMECYADLIRSIATLDPLEGAWCRDLVEMMGREGKGWAWAPFILPLLIESFPPATHPRHEKPLTQFLKTMPEWTEGPRPPPPSYHPVDREAVSDRLRRLTWTKGTAEETRPAQHDYAAHVAGIFGPLPPADRIPTALIEAGTGVGKTLGYIAPASLWAEMNESPVWLSTYTKNLQRQIDQELHRLYPDEGSFARHVAIRKGRENYLCLLNFDDMARAAPFASSPRTLVAAGLMARWIRASADGDLTGRSFPGWLVGLLGYGQTWELADRRGECIYAACDHYKKCFIERSIRKAREARLVIANHALVLIQSGLAGMDDILPTHLIFDEAHHLFEAADQIFALRLTAMEGADLRRWIIGPEGGRRSRARGLKKRLDGLLVNADQQAVLDQLVAEARGLPDGETVDDLEHRPPVPFTRFLKACVACLQALKRSGDPFFESEIALKDARVMEGDLIDSARSLRLYLGRLAEGFAQLAAFFRTRLEEEGDTLLEADRIRLTALERSFERQRLPTIRAWMDVCEDLAEGRDNPLFIDRLVLLRQDGRKGDVGLVRHYRDPMHPFTQALKGHAKGVAMTSATLQASRNDAWDFAMQRTGAGMLDPLADRVAIPSPFDYAAQARILVIRDIPRDDNAQLANAYRHLFLAAKGGALGLFTAIARLRAVHERIAEDLAMAGLPLFAQHIDDLDNGTLVDMFRDDPAACLLGTDAMRDGVDVPGESLRLVAFDRVPWPRPSLVHKARRAIFDGRTFDDDLTRLRLKQAFGRLIRTRSDKGVFVLLDGGLPTHLENAFPEGVHVQRLGLAEALGVIRAFLWGEA